MIPQALPFNAVQKMRRGSAMVPVVEPCWVQYQENSGKQTDGVPMPGSLDFPEKRSSNGRCQYVSLATFGL